MKSGINEKERKKKERKKKGERELDCLVPIDS